MQSLCPSLGPSTLSTSPKGPQSDFHLNVCEFNTVNLKAVCLYQGPVVSVLELLAAVLKLQPTMAQVEFLEINCFERYFLFAGAGFIIPDLLVTLY